ncbi:hypothetical protein G6F50_016467 [Rhizopus delemar]|uniref:Uncharacterized protein n=1 Tax=Rhizopus delemar TaxID=936053 RepID=A0A9P6XT63_9FUNG|nr:hypothetical protein G6F50_016467 [Rhizopus delemar]
MGRRRRGRPRLALPDGQPRATHRGLAAGRHVAGGCWPDHADAGAQPFRGTADGRHRRVRAAGHPGHYPAGAGYAGDRQDADRHGFRAGRHLAVPGAVAPGAAAHALHRAADRTDPGRRDPRGHYLCGVPVRPAAIAARLDDRRFLGCAAWPL